MFDIVILSVLVVLGLKGMITGLVRELSGLIGIVGGVFIGSRIGSTIGEFINNIFHFESQKAVILMGFLTSLALFWLFSMFIGTLIASAVKALGLAPFDKLLGFAFGAGKIFFIFSIIFYAFSSVAFVNKKMEEKIGDTIMYPILKTTGGYIVKLDSDVLTNIKDGNLTTIQKDIPNAK